MTLVTAKPGLIPKTGRPRYHNRLVVWQALITKIWWRNQDSYMLMSGP